VGSDVDCLETRCERSRPASDRANPARKVRKETMLVYCAEDRDRNNDRQLVWDEHRVVAQRLGS